MTPVFLSDSVWLPFGTSSVSTGAATDADSTPTVTVLEDGVALGYAPTVSNITTGLYAVQVDATGANGFEAGRRYALYAVATVGAVTGRDGIGEFEVLATDLNTGVASVTGAVGSVTGLTASNLDDTISSRMATYTQPTGFLAATFPAGTVANTTNITAGTITTATTVTDVTNERSKYALGAVWIGPTANTNTVSYVDGIITNPVSTIAAAKTVADALKLRRFYTVRTGASQITATMTGYDFAGVAWSLTSTGSQDVGTSAFTGAELTGGTFAATTGTIIWHDCDFPVAVSVGKSHMTLCTFGSTLTLSETGDYDFIDCASVVAGAAAPVFAVPAGVVNISFRRWSGGIRLTGLTADTTVSIDVVSGGTVTLEGTAATVVIRGMVTGVTNSMSPSAGSVTQTAVVNQGSIADAVWDEDATAHQTQGTFGQAIGDPAADTNTLYSDVGAIKAKTDSLTFTVAGMTDANIQAVNDVTVTGNGQPGTEWGP